MDQLYMGSVFLTEREQEVYALHIERDFPARTVAEWLQLSHHTVRRHAEKIRAKYAAAGQPLPDKRRHFFLSGHVNENSASINAA